jgi:predicted TIM-barrel fold metal-dependent hydrolase
LVQAINRPPYVGKFTRATVEGELKRFYYDTAQVANNVTLAAMAQLMPISQIFYGTDFPYRSAAEHTKGMTEFFKGSDLRAIDRENALRLIPRLKTA